MDYRIIWSAKAASHLEGICNYIGQDSASYARIFARRVLSLIRTCSKFPRAGRIVPEYNDPTIREKICGNYRIIYCLDEKGTIIKIVAICHCARQIKNVF